MHSVGLALTFPNATVVGVDGAAASLQMARKVSEEHGVSDRVRFVEGNYLEPLDYLSSDFDVALACGTLHHSVLTPDASGKSRSGRQTGLRNILEMMKPGGLVGIMIYSERGYRREKELGELFRVVSGYDAHGDHRLLREYAEAYFEKWLSWRDRSVRELMFSVRRAAKRAVRRLLWKQEISYLDSVRGSEAYFMDTYAVPVADPVDSIALRQLIEEAGIEILDLAGCGSPNPDALPTHWRDRFSELSFWDQVRAMELLYPYVPPGSPSPFRPQSFSLVARKTV